jgi:hypothetical protein
MWLLILSEAIYSIAEQIIKVMEIHFVRDQ